MMKLFKQEMTFKVIVLSVALALPSGSVNAQGWMEDFFTSAGAGMNVNAAGVYETQTQSVIGLGGFSYRAPQRGFRPFSFSGPGYRAGCGGIDTWLGAYGFANKNEFVSALRNIGQNAVGYFFKLAMATMAPEIDKTLNDISTQIQRLNNMQINSCQEVKRFVGTAPDTTNMDFLERAKVLGSAVTGEYGDYSLANEATKTSPSKTEEVVKNACNANSILCQDSSGNLVVKRDANIVFDALKKTQGFPIDDIDLFITVLGTVVFTKNDADISSGSDPTYYPSALSWKDFVGDATGATTLKVRKCPDANTCIYTTTNLSDTVVSNSFARIVRTSLFRFRDAILNRTALDANNVDDKKIFQIAALSSVPITQIISKAIDNGKGSQLIVDNLIELYSDVIAHEIAYQYLVVIDRDVSQAFTAYKTAAMKGQVNQVEDLERSIDKVMATAAESYQQILATNADRVKNVEVMLTLQRAMHSSLGSRLMANATFDKQQQD